MYEVFKREGGSYLLPNGKTKTSAEFQEDPQYSMLFNMICAADVINGIFRSYRPLADLASQYSIDYTEGTTDPETTVDLINEAIQKEKEDPTVETPIPMRASMINAMVQVAQISAMSFTDEQALEVKDIYPEYQVDHAYKQGEFFTHEGELYKVNQDHTSASQWEPGSVGTESLYTHLTLNEDGYPIWKQPTGAHDAYNKGDIVEYNGELYKSLIDGNAYSPDTYPAGWEKYTEPTE